MVALGHVSAGCLQRALNRHPLCLLAAALILVATVSRPVSGAEIEQKELIELPLEQLMDVSVVSASRKSQSLSDIASAVFVINQEDIRRSGATTIPDLLRMVPGVQVATVDGTTWAVSIRGFNGTFANKLLVMLDGRSVYSPLYGGVFWDVQDVLLEDIERIEVIRGPGSTMWGANAVNGVINIITKNAHDTGGALATGMAGTRERGTAGARYGATIGGSTSYRLYAKYVNRGGTPSTTDPTADALNVTRGGFRVDSAPTDAHNLTIQGDVYRGHADHAATVPIFSPPFSSTVAQKSELFGADLLARLDWLQSEGSEISLQLYYDRTDRDTSFVDEGRDTVDIDLQHTIRFASVHEVTWGGGYRYLHDHTPGSNVFALAPVSNSDNFLNLFAQDEITLVPGTLRLILGTKVEHIELSGWEVEPSAKLSFTPARGYGVWGSVTRAVRTPTRGEKDVTIARAVIPPFPPVPLPTLVTLQGSRQLESESLLAYEVGVRAEPNAVFSIDLSTFFNRYHDIIGTALGPPFQEGNHLTLPNVFTNNAQYDSAGGELVLQWQPAEWWKLKGGYAYIRFFGEGVEDSFAVKGTPTHQGTLRSLFSLGRDLDLDVWGRYVGASRYPLGTGTVGIPPYFTADIRVAWRPRAGLELSLTGQNLLEKRHAEGVSDQNSARHEVERTLYGKVTWAF